MLRTWKGGRAKLNGYLEDYAHFADGLLELYQTTFDAALVRCRARAGRRDPRALRRSQPAGSSTRATTTRRCSCGPRGLQDGAVPSGGAMAASVLLRLAEYTGEGRYADAAKARCGAAAADGSRAARVRPLARGARLRARPAAGARHRRRRSGRRCSPWRGPRYRPNLVVAAGRRARISGSPCWRAGRPSTARPRPTCAGSSPASGRSRPRRSWRSSSSETGGAPRERYAALVGHDAAQFGRIQ